MVQRRPQMRFTRARSAPRVPVAGPGIPVHRVFVMVWSVTVPPPVLMTPPRGPGSSPESPPPCPGPGARGRAA